MAWIYLPNITISLINTVGLLTTAFYIAKVIFALKTKIITKKWPKNPQEFKYFLLEQENIRLSSKIEALEQENTEMLTSIINQLKG
jgi:hypothetical protein